MVESVESAELEKSEESEVVSVPLAALLLFHKDFQGFWLLESQQPFSLRIASQMLLMGSWALSLQL